jgi:NOL1/NOP2/fmu family ribosome biogenesis protein
VLVYSTCSFELAEDEGQVAQFLERHAHFRLDDAVTHPALAPGIGLERTARIWPHRAPGDGQFVARLLREGEAAPEPARRPDHRKPDRTALAVWHAFRDEILPGFETDDDAIRVIGDTLYLVPEAARDLDPRALSRPGLLLGRRRPGRFEPAHALATAVQPAQAAQRAPWSEAYLRGETVPHTGPDGWTLVCFERWGLGWARRTRGVLKNFFPKGLRRAG